jgi:hypothetical protein
MRFHGGMRRAAFVLAALVGLGFAYVLLVRPWHRHWGATRAEVARPLPGDGLVGDPQEVTTRAITIRARPEQVWPWLAQMGRGRGGLYSYDALDRAFGVLDAPSAQALLPQFQRLAPGDTIPIGGSVGWPVAIADPNRTLLLNVNEAGARVTWVFVLAPISSRETRLVTRVRARLPAGWKSAIIGSALDPAEFVMVRRMLLNLRDRAERLARRTAP